MEVLEDEDELWGVEGGFVGFEHSFFSEVGEELPTCNVFHEEVNVFAVLVHALKIDNERVADWFQDLVLVADVIHLLCFD